MDVTRVTAWLLVPLSLVLAIVLAGQGVIQNFDAYKDVATLEITSYSQSKKDANGEVLKDAKGEPVMEDLKTAKQTIAMGPVASQLQFFLTDTAEQQHFFRGALYFYTEANTDSLAPVYDFMRKDVERMIKGMRAVP